MYSVLWTVHSTTRYVIAVSKPAWPRMGGDGRAAPGPGGRLTAVCWPVEGASAGQDEHTTLTLCGASVARSLVRRQPSPACAARPRCEWRPPLGWVLWWCLVLLGAAWCRVVGGRAPAVTMDGIGQRQKQRCMLDPATLPLESVESNCVPVLWAVLMARASGKPTTAGDPPENRRSTGRAALPFVSRLLVGRSWSVAVPVARGRQRCQLQGQRIKAD